MTQPPGFDPQPPVPPQAAPPAGQQAIPHSPHEFSPSQDEIIRGLARKMNFVGIFYVVTSCFLCLAGLIALFFSPLIGVFYFILLIPELLIGIWTIHASRSFRLVVDTTGRDIPHLMGALTDLRKLYTLMFWLLIAALMIVLLAVAAGILLWTMGIIPGTTDSSTFTALLAEKQNHHPDINIRWNKVYLALSTHSAGGITEFDFKLAKAIDEL